MAVSDLGVICGRLVYHFFNKFTSKPMETQRKIFGVLMKKNKNTEYGKKYHFDEIHTLEEFQDKVPLTTFEDYSDYIDRMINNGEKNLITAYKVKRYASSSGSVGKPKQLPKSSKDLMNMQEMGFCAPMGLAWQYYHDRGEKLGKLKGPLVLVLSGSKLSNGMKSNGAAQIPLQYIKPLTPLFTCTPVEVMYPEHPEEMNIVYLQLRYALPDENVTYIGSGVITLLTSMFEYLEDNWRMIVDDIEKGTIDPSVKMPEKLRKKYEKRLKPNPERAAFLRKEFEKGFDTPICPRIWPKLKWCYGMAGSNLIIYAEKNRRWIGDIPMHNMGYGAAEGFFAMPVKMNARDYCLLPRSIIFEFIPVDAPEGTRPVFMDKIKQGEEYEMIVTNFSGLYRYRLYDVVKVTGMHNNTPMVEFSYRKNLGMNIANEKMTVRMLDWAVKELERDSGIEFVGHSFYGEYDSNPSHYVLLAEPKNGISDEQKKKCEDILDEKLSETNEKYLKYRKWNTLGRPVLKILKKGTYESYNEMLVGQGKVLNQIKPVTIINNKERKDFFFSHVDK